MIELPTLTGKPFQYKKINNAEIIVYPSDKQGNYQEKSAIVITPYVVDLVKETIRNRGEIRIGFSRDNPPDNSLGNILKNNQVSPQILSYLIPILEEESFCISIKKFEGFFVKINEKIK